jgi:DNA-binding NtrC family response regulator
VLSGPDQGKQLLLERGTYYVGKARTCELALTDGAVSRRHLELVMDPKGVIVRDLESKNGSFLDGARFREVTLSAGAVVTVGGTKLRVTGMTESPPIPASRSDHFGALYGNSLVMRQLFTLLERIAESDAPVLVEGETGTGKELCAEAIHAASPRCKRPFVVCDLAGSARTLIESELFGHRKGAFTGAAHDHVGAFAAAESGTLFLDEIGELELTLQPRLLRAVEQRKVKALGANAYHAVDVRVVAATNRALQDECEAGRFRPDLYHRLAVMRVRLPPLRERTEDIPLLAERFLAEHRVKIGTEALAVLCEYNWPGNVRELKNLLERGISVVGERGELTPHALGIGAPGVVGPLDFHSAKEEAISAWERSFLAELLRRSEGNLAQAARQVGVARPHLYRLLKKHGMGQGKP